jgi:deoxyribose-phosphate aldolase
VKQYETRRAIFDGATEIDMVINIGALKSGDVRLVEQDIEAVTSACRECGVVSKVIIEAACSPTRRRSRLHVVEGRGRRLREDVHRLRSGGATVADVALDAARGRRGNGRQGGGRRARLHAR